MTNKYLEKIASNQNEVDVILQDHAEREYEIESPIRDMHNDFDQIEELYPREEGHSRNFHQSYIYQSIKDNRESSLRRDLDLESKHMENNLFTAKRLLSNKNLSEHVTDSNASSIISKFKNIPHESNGYIGLKNAGMIGSAIAGGALGFSAGKKSFNPLVGLATTAAGALGGGILGHYGFKGLLKNPIEHRQEEIYNNRENLISKAYDKLSRTLVSSK